MAIMWISYGPFFLIVLGYAFLFTGLLAAIAALYLWYGAGKSR
ncbi:hypothetical protein [Paenalcaligenes suwonensis]|nr:hypothetical protein [Paenalcaligenes suwonensis]